MCTRGEEVESTVIARFNTSSNFLQMLQTQKTRSLPHEGYKKEAYWGNGQ